MKRPIEAMGTTILLLSALLVAAGACDLPQGGSGGEQTPPIALTVTVVGLGVVDVQGHGTASSASTTVYPVDANATISLNARPHGYFVGWLGDVADENNSQTTIIMSESQEITAIFPVRVPITTAGWRGRYTVADGSSSTTSEIWTCAPLSQETELEWQLTFISEIHFTDPGGSTTGTVAGSDSFLFPTRPTTSDPWLSNPTDFTFSGPVDTNVHGTVYPSVVSYHYTNWVYELTVLLEEGEVTSASIDSVAGEYDFCVTMLGFPSCSGPQDVSSRNGNPSVLIPERHPDCPPVE